MRKESVKGRLTSIANEFNVMSTFLKNVFDSITCTVSATALSTPLLPGPLTDVEKCFCALHHRGPKFEKQKLNVIMLRESTNLERTWEHKEGTKLS